MKEEIVAGLESYVELKEHDARDARLNDDDSGKEHQRYMEALETLKSIEHNNMEYYDKQERREIERKKNEDTARIEAHKSYLGGKRMALEVAKISVPVVTGLLSAVTVLVMQNKAGKFEETGTWTSQASRMAHNQSPKLKW